MINKKRILVMISILSILFVGCTSSTKKGEKTSSKQQENSSDSNVAQGPTSSTEKGEADYSTERVDLYGDYAKDKHSVSSPIPYLKCVNEMDTPKNPLNTYSESEMLSFYKNTNAKGVGDSSKYWRWKFKISQSDLSKVLNSTLPSLYKSNHRDVLTYSNGEWIEKSLGSNPVGTVKEVKFLQRGSSGIGIKMLVKGTNGEYLVVKEGNIRKALNLSKASSTINVYGAKGGSSSYDSSPILKNPSMIPSAFFAVDRNGSSYEFYGGGFGHGSGMCQWGVSDLVKNRGYSYKDVLKRYYPGAKLSDISSVSNGKKNVRVGIMTSGFSSMNHSSITLVSPGGLKIKGSNGGTTISPGNKVVIKRSGNNIQVSSNGRNCLTSSTPLTVTSSDLIGVPSIKRGVKKHPYPMYRGEFEIRLAKGSSGLLLINELPIEKYLLQVVSSEMPQSFGLEALKVQAIAARTYAIRDCLKGKYKSNGFDILDSVQSQVYNNSDESSVTTEAVKATEGKILTHNSEPIDAKYFSTSSGFTSNAHNVW